MRVRKQGRGSFSSFRTRGSVSGACSFGVSQTEWGSSCGILTIVRILRLGGGGYSRFPALLETPRIRP